MNSDTLTTLKNLDSLWHPSNPAESEKSFKDLLPFTQEFTGTDRLYHIELLLQISRTQVFQKKVAEGRITIDQVKAQIELFSKEVPGEDTLPMIIRCRWLMERSRLFILERTPAQARSLLEDALKVTKDDQLIVEIYQMIAAIESQKEQQAWISKAIDLAEKSPNVLAKRWLGSLYTTLGWKLFDLRQFDKALATFERAAKQLAIDGTKRELFVARWSSGKILRAMGKFEEALAIQNELLKEIRLEGTHDGRLYEEIAECLQSLNRAEEAVMYFELAYHELSKNEWVTDNQPVKLKRMKDLGQVKTKRASAANNES